MEFSDVSVSVSLSAELEEFPCLGFSIDGNIDPIVV